MQSERDAAASLSSVRSLSSAAPPAPKQARSPGAQSKAPPKQRAPKAERGPVKGAKAAGGDEKKYSCHYCRQKRGDIVSCPQHVEGHRWCGSCVRNHLGLDIEKIRLNPSKAWPEGCVSSRAFTTFVSRAPCDRPF